MVSIHVPLAEHDLENELLVVLLLVSIHVPLAEHDAVSRSAVKLEGVSIHVPLAEHDLVRQLHRLGRHGFNSRAPRGARHTASAAFATLSSFNSRAPRGARP